MEEEVSEGEERRGRWWTQGEGDEEKGNEEFMHEEVIFE